MRTLSGKAAAEQVEKLAVRSARFDEVEPKVQRIIDDVRARGEAAVREYSRQWDGLGEKDSLQVREGELRAAWKASSPKFRSSLKLASANIRRFCELQKPKEWKKSYNGITLGQLVRPLDSVGCYIPGGRHPLVSTLLMTVIPAQVAGVKNIRVVSPRPPKEVLAAAAMLGICEFYQIGGAQAVAALAYGTKSVPRVDKIVGPGNVYVTAAKKLVSFDRAIDMLAGPTEVVVVSHSGKPAYIASDLVAQAEHDPDAISIFITTSAKLAEAVSKSVEDLAQDNDLAKQSLATSGVILIASSRTEAMEWANKIAPEHISVAKSDVSRVRNAGSIFVGDFSPQAGGDYASGPNHVLPTAGVARFRGGLSVMDFVKIITMQELSKKGLRGIASAVEFLAETEGLNAHAESIRVRCGNA
ncbi:MAG TPA: histidinol dehydrogenase [Terriglobales bacterium]|jgi:histidinol dehydrogenase